MSINSTSMRILGAFAPVLLLVLSVIARAQSVTLPCELYIDPPSTQSNPMDGLSGPLGRDGISDIKAAMSGVGQRPWNIDGPGWKYEPDFAALFQKLGISDPANYFQRFVDQRRAQGRPTNTVDLFGSGFFVKSTDSMTGIRFEPFELTQDQIAIGYKMPTQVIGDILKDSTWAQFDQSWKERNIHGGINFAVLRPVAGWKSVPAEEEIQDLHYIMENLFARRDPDFQFFFSVPIRNQHLEEEPLILEFKNKIAQKGFEMICAGKRAVNSCVIRGIEEPGPAYP